MSGRALGAMGGIGVLAALAAIGLASRLDQPVGGSAPDKAQPIVAGPVVGPGEELTGGPESLPPLALVLDRPLPAAVARGTAGEQAAALEGLARGGDPRRLVELGSAYQRAGDQARATRAYSLALRAAPDDLAARAGLAMADGATGAAGLVRAAVVLRGLAQQNPRSQLVAFNEGWLAVYRRQAQEAVAAWQRTVTLGPRTPLGVTAGNLLVTIGGRAGGGRP